MGDIGASALAVASSEFIVGGQKSGKSRRAQALARVWLGQRSGNRAVLIATARAGDDEMRSRIARHQRDRARELPGLVSVERPLALAVSVAEFSRPETLVIVDCLTLWLTNAMWPEHCADGAPARTPMDATAAVVELHRAVDQARGPLVLVGNEIGLGVIPMGREVRGFVDALGQLNQAAAAISSRVTLMVAGLPLLLKDTA